MKILAIDDHEATVTELESETKTMELSYEEEFIALDEMGGLQIT